MNPRQVKQLPYSTQRPRNDGFGPILLKKSGLVSAAEKYASEIEIFTFGRGFQAQISSSTVQKRRFHWSMTRQFWMTDFFNRIGRFLPFVTANYGLVVTSQDGLNCKTPTGLQRFLGS